MSMETFLVTENGEIKKVSKLPSRSINTALVIDKKTRRIYLLVSEKAKIRQKFIAAQVATKIRRENGAEYRIKSIDLDEAPEFLRNEIIF